jgi:hypothetical protein
MPALWRQEGMVVEPRTLFVRRMQASSFGYNRDYFSGQSLTSYGLVPSYVVCNEPKKRNKRSWVAAFTGAAELQDSVGYAA